MKKVVEAILKYQDDKRALVLEETGIDLIPDDVKLTEADVEENLNKILEGFRPSCNLTSDNCLHCSIYKCEECKYSVGCIPMFYGASAKFNNFAEMMEIGEDLKKVLDEERGKSVSSNAYNN